MRLFSLFRRPTPSDGEGERDQPDGSGFFPDDPNYRRHMSDIAGADVGAPPDFSRWSWRGPRFPATGPGPDTGEAARAQLQADVDAGRATRNGTPLGPPSDDLSFDFGGPMPIVQPLDPNRNRYVISGCVKHDRNTGRRAEPTSPMPPPNPHPGTALPYSFSLPGTSSDEAEENRNAPRGQFPPLNVYSPMSDDGAGIPRPSYSRPPSPPLPTLSEQPESSQAAEQRIEREQQRPCSSSREPRSPGPNQSFKGYQNRWRQAQNVASQRSTSSVRFAGADPNNPPPNRPRPLRKLTSTPIERQGPNLPPQTGGDDYFSHTPGTSSAPRPRNSRAHDSEAGRVPLPPSAPIDRTDTSPLPPRSESEERKDRRRNPVDGPLLDADRSPSPAYRRRLSGRTSSIDDSARVTTEGPSSERSSTPENSPRVVHPENGAYRSALAEERRQRMRRHQAATAMTVRDSKSKSHIRKTIRDIVSLRTYKANKKEKKKQKRRQQRRKKKQKEEGGQKKEEGLKEAVKSDDENSDDEIDRSIWPLKRSESVRPQEISLDEGLKAWKAWKRKFSQQENTLDPTPYPYVSDSATPSKTPPATKFLGKLPSLGKRPSLNQLMVGRDDVWNLINSYTPEMTEREKKESEARKAMWVRDAVEPCTPTELPLSERLLELHMAIYDEHLPNGEKSGHVPPKQSTGYMHHDFRKAPDFLAEGVR